MGKHQQVTAEFAMYKAKKTGNLKNKKSLVCYIAFMALPVLQFILFYVVVNFNSFLLAFEKIDITTGTVRFTFQNFAVQFKRVVSSEMLNMIKVSLISYGMHLIVGVPLGLIFSYYIYKKRLWSSVFRVMLFLPSIIPAIVLVTIYKNFVDGGALSDILFDLFHLSSKPKGLLENMGTRFGTILFYNIFVSFGTSVLMYSNKMCSIAPEMSEAANLDGATGLKEFWYIALPMTCSTISVFLTTGVVSIFSNQINLFSFYGWEPPADLQTFGYYLFYQTSAATTSGNTAEYPPLAALGLILTAVAIPLTFFVRYVFRKFAPSED